MFEILFEHWKFNRYHGPRRRLISAAATIGAMAGLWVAGKLMIAMGWFTPGVTLNSRILDFWPGFLAGLVLGALLCSIPARFLASFLFDE